jgi:hypothetical protein
LSSVPAVRETSPDVESALASADAAFDAIDLSVPPSPPADVPAPAVESPAVTTAIPEPPAPPVQATPAVPTAQPEQGTPAAPASDYESLKAQIAELKQALTAQQTPKVETPEAPAEPPPTPQELVDLDNIISGVSLSYQTAKSQVEQAIPQRDQWFSTLNKLNRQLRKAEMDPTIDKGKVINDIEAAEEAIAQYDRFIQAKQGEQARLVQDFRLYENQRETMKRLHTLTQDQERRVREAEQASLERQSTDWRKSKWEPAKSAAATKVPEALRKGFDSYVERLGKAQVHSRDAQGRYSNGIEDVNAFVNSAAEEFLAIAREGALSYSTTKIADAQVSSPPPGKAATPTPTRADSLKTVEDLERHLEAEWDRVSL